VLGWQDLWWEVDFVIKRGYAIFFLQRANGGRRRNRGGEEGGRSSGHN